MWTAYELRISDWSSDVCCSDLLKIPVSGVRFPPRPPFGDSRRDRGNASPATVPADAGLFVCGGALFRQRVGDHVIADRGLHELVAAGHDAQLLAPVGRSEERRVGKACGSPCRSGWWPQN